MASISPLLIGIVIATVLVTVYLIQTRGGAVENYFFRPLDNLRTVAGGLILLFGVVHALKSGTAWMILAAMVGIAFAVAFVYYEEPHKDIR